MKCTRTKVKVCGVTRVEDAVTACNLGADAIGLNFYPPSPRCLSVDQARRIVAALPAFVDSVAVFVNASVAEMTEIAAATGVACIQLHGDEPPEIVAQLSPRRVLRAFRWKGPETAEDISNYVRECDRLGLRPVGLLIDAYCQGLPGGTGDRWEWSEAKLLELDLPLILAGGLDSTNVGSAIAQLHPYAVDVASGVESSPGVKDSEKLRAFFASVAESSR